MLYEPKLERFITYSFQQHRMQKNYFSTSNGFYV